MDREQIKPLIEKYIKGTASDEELTLVETWYNTYEEELHPELNDAMITNATNRVEKRFLVKRNKIKLWPRYLGIAAAAIAAIAFGVWFYEVASTRTALPRNDVAYKNDIAPGKNTATLTSSNGSTINLSEAKTGVAINATAVTYNDGTTIDPSALGMTDGDSRSLEVITPKGGTYSIILQDGTKVWLNADSKLEFLSNYRNKLQRIVKLTGEGYFEVAKVFSPGKAGRGPERVPFIVESNGQRVEVLGTHFNISAYKGEAIRTTLLEGSVSVRHFDDRRNLLNSTNKRSLPAVRDDVVLKPNQQAILSDQGIKCIQVNAKLAIAWKNGKFRFDDASLEEVMKQLSRWYDVEVVYPNGIPERSFTGGINRNITAAEALSLFQFSNVKFKIEGKKIIVEK